MAEHDELPTPTPTPTAAAATLAAIRAHQEHARQETEVSSPLLFGVRGVAMLIGYLVLVGAAAALVPLPTAYLVLAIAGGGFVLAALTALTVGRVRAR